jgi:MFS family permease
MSARATAGGSTAGLAVGWNVGNVGAVAATLSDAYGVSLAAIGLFTTTLFIVHLGIQVPGGRLADRRGARKVAITGLLVIAAANAIASARPELALGLVARAIAGAGTGLAFIAGSDYVRASGGSPLAQGIYGGVNLGGGGLALAIVPLLVGPLGWRAPFVSAIGVCAISVAALLLGPPDARHSHPADAATAQLRRLVPGLTRLGVLHTASFGLNVVVSTWVVTLLVRAGGYTDRAAGAIGALTLLVGIVSRPLGGWIRRAHPDRTRGACAASLAAGALATALLAWAGPAWAMAPAALMVGLAAGIPFAAVFTGAALTHPDAPGAAVAFVNASAGVAILGAAPLLGLTFELPSDGRIGFLALAVAWAAALLVLPRQRELGIHGRVDAL